MRKSETRNVLIVTLQDQDKHVRKNYFVIPKNPEKLDPSRPDPDRSQNIHPAGLYYGRSF
jgi:hypothetical protein